MGEGGSWMVRVGFLDLRPMAEANVLNFLLCFAEPEGALSLGKRGDK